jgi:cobalt-zinc-cadmium efflux system outer membrane protein
MPRKIFILTLAGLLFFIPSLVYAEEPVSLESLIKEAIQNNPNLKAAYNEWKAQEFKVVQAASLPDPMASFTYFGANVETRVGPQQNKYGLSQKVPFPGKLSLKAKSQAKQAAIFKEKYEAAKRELIKNIKFVYLDIYWIDQATQVSDEEKSIIESLEKVSQKKYESNIVGQQDVIKAQVELSRLIERLMVYEQQRKSYQARLNSLLNRPKEVPLAKVRQISLRQFSYGLAELQEFAQEGRQELAAAGLDVQRREYEKSLAKLDFAPDFTFGFDYIQVGSGHTTMPNDGEDAWMGTVAVSVPLWFNKLSAQLKEKKAALEASKLSYKNTENEVAYEVQDIYFKIVTYKDIVSLYKTALLPQTEQSFEAARASYETGQTDFLNWLDAERMLLATRLAYYKAIVDYSKSIAYLERVVGRDL